jgi:hypothetical protein
LSVGLEDILYGIHKATPSGPWASSRGVEAKEMALITPAIKHVNKFCGMPVFPENSCHALIYLVAGLIIMTVNAYFHNSSVFTPYLFVSFSRNGEAAKAA